MDNEVWKLEEIPAEASGGEVSVARGTCRVPLYQKGENMEKIVLKEIIKKSQEWLEEAEAEDWACYADLYDTLYSLEIAAGICLHNELNPDEPIDDEEQYQQTVYDLIDKVLGNDEIES